MGKIIRRVYDKYKLLHRQSEALEFKQKTLLRQTELDGVCGKKIVNSATGASYDDVTKKQKCEEDKTCIYTDQQCIYNTGENLEPNNILISKFYRDKYRKSKDPLSIMPYLSLHELKEPKIFDTTNPPKLFYISIDGQYLKFIGTNIYISCDMDDINNVCKDFSKDNSDYGFRNNFCGDEDKTDCEDDTGFLFTLIKVENLEIYDKYYIGKGTNNVPITKDELMKSTYPFYLIAPFNYPKQYVSLSVDEKTLKKKLKIEYPKTYNIRSKQKFLLSDDRPLRHNDYNLLTNFKDYTEYCDNQQC